MVRKKAKRTVYVTAIDGAPKIGIYQFAVTAGGMTATATDVQHENKVVPLPDSSQFVPATTVVNAMTPEFSWKSVDFDDAFYRLEIKNYWNGSRVYATKRVAGMLSAVIPQGKLYPGAPYYWRIRVVDADDWVGVQNRANSAWVPFTMASELEPVTLSGSIRALKAVACEGFVIGVDINGDEEIGLAEAVFGLQRAAGIR